MTNRLQILDRLRGLATVLMILAHSFVIFGDNQNILLDKFSDYTDIVAYTTFVFASGAAGYLSIIRHKLSTERLEQKYTKTTKMLFVYYMTAAFVMIYYIDDKSFITIITELGRIAILFNLPAYTEFLLSLIIYSFLMILFRNQIKALLKNNFALLLTIVFSYLIGYFLHQVSTPHFLTYYKAILFGESNWYRFPIFQYLPILLIGLKWAEQVNTHKKLITSLTTKLLIYVSIIITSLFALNYFNVIAELSIVRWPPNILFLSLGLGFIAMAIIILNNKRIQLLTKPLNNIGQIALSSYVVHIFILFIYRLFYDKILSNSILIILFSFIVLISAVLFSKLITHAVSQNEEKKEGKSRT